MTSTSAAYEERHGWSRGGVLSVSISSVLCALALIGAATLHSPRLLVTGALLLVGACRAGWNIVRHPLALRVDEHGITLTGPRWRVRSTVTVPWSEARCILVWEKSFWPLVGVAKQQSAGLPERVDQNGNPRPDVVARIDTWRLDAPRLEAAARMFAPELPLLDLRHRSVQDRAAAAETPESLAVRKAARRRATRWAGAGALVLAGLLVALFVSGRAASAADSYTVQAGPADSEQVLSLPSRIGQLTFLMNDQSYAWTYYPNLVPTGPTTSYDIVAGDYASADPSAPDISVDGIFAMGTGGDTGVVFSRNPQALGDLIASTLDMTDMASFPAGAPGAVLRCGVYATEPLCFRVADSTLVFVEYFGIPGTIAQLASLTSTAYAGLITG